MKTQKKDEVKSLLTAGNKRRYLHNLQTGLYYIDGQEVSEQEFRQKADNKEVMIDLGSGEPPDNT